MPVRTRAVASRAALLMKLARERPDLFSDFESCQMPDCPRSFTVVRRVARGNEARSDQDSSLDESDEKVANNFLEEEIRCEAEYVHSKDLPDELKTSLVDITRENMKELYDRAGETRLSWVWNDQKKIDELSHKSARHFIVYASAGKTSSTSHTTDDSASVSESNSTREVIGFAHIRFEIEVGRELVYLYEFQVAPKYMGCGIGKYLLKLVEASAAAMKCQEVCLTCFKANDALNFYKKYGFKLDPDSPDEKSCPYEILSKPVKKKK